MDDKIIHKELSYLINGCIYDVHNEVGPGLREECYQKSLEHGLNQAGIPFIAKPATRRDLLYRGIVVDTFEPDVVVAELIIPELKHHPEGLARENFTQVLSYLKFWDLRLGLLINFAMNKAVIERVPYTPKRAEPEERYENIRPLIRPEHRPLLRAIRDGLLEINREIGLGYAVPTYRNLAIVEFQHRGIRCDKEIIVHPEFRSLLLPTSPITPIIVEGRICVEIEAVHDGITARAIRTMQTHLRITGCDVGLIACFGKTKFLIEGVSK
jgi:GxxExxY protein